MIAPVKAIIGIASTSLVLAQVSVPSTAVEAAGRLTLDAALVIAVGVLWKALAAKDVQLVAMTSKVTETMVSVLDAVKELRVSVTDLKSAYAGLHCTVQSCTMRNDGQKRN